MTGREVVDDALASYKGMSLDMVLLGQDHWPDFCAELNVDPEQEWVEYRNVRIVKAATLDHGAKLLLRK